MITITKITDKSDLEAAYAVREKVFVEEQQVPREEEYDEFEEIAQHYLARYNTIPCGAARWRKTNKGIKLERFAVLADYRNKAIGSRILEQVLQDVKAAYPNEVVYLHAQVPAVPFYGRQGFVAEGPMFSECDIDHYKMILHA
ncbi:GNAT family N-acetyltransferase [Adhaeribacter aquaticus]|uniref:GNAT family N-acetyltransferase n=1 Tax=Adhaeribacter aquaticus TaxID=299567 RepID=UPI0003FD24E6|nr:GNAT family N-acetyltransferase [Adhaeribacter aquaticus]